jgi:hypothetical protein
MAQAQSPHILMSEDGHTASDESSKLKDLQKASGKGAETPTGGAWHESVADTWHDTVNVTISSTTTAGNVVVEGASTAGTAVVNGASTTGTAIAGLGSYILSLGWIAGSSGAPEENKGTTEEEASWRDSDDKETVSPGPLEYTAWTSPNSKARVEGSAIEVNTPASDVAKVAPLHNDSEGAQPAVRESESPSPPHLGRRGSEHDTWKEVQTPLPAPEKKST